MSLHKEGGGALESNVISWLGGSPALGHALPLWLESLLASEMGWDRPVKRFYVEGAQNSLADPRVRERIHFIV